MASMSAVASHMCGVRLVIRMVGNMHCLMRIRRVRSVRTLVLRHLLYSVGIRSMIMLHGCVV